MMYGMFGGCDTRNRRKGAAGGVAATMITIFTPPEGGACGNDAGYATTRTGKKVNIPGTQYV